MKKEDILKMRNIEVDRLKKEKPMLFHNILKAMDDYAEQVKNLTIQNVTDRTSVTKVNPEQECGTPYYEL